MEILLVSATFAEIAPFLQAYGLKNIPEKGLKIGNHQVKIVITGVGMVATAYALGKAFAENNYDLSINIGVAGSFSTAIKIGDLVQVNKDTFSELGAQDDEDFLSLEEMELGENTFYGSDHPSHITSLKKADAITVNMVHGNEDSIEEVKEMYHPKLESMEGAAFFYACDEAGMPGIQIRAISNFVEKRNKASWNMPLAIKNLNYWLKQYLEEL